MRFILPAVAFSIHYLAVALVCGGVFRRVDGAGPGAPAGRRHDDPDERRQRLAALLIGTGLAPFVIALLSGAFWLLLPGRPGWVYPALHWALLLPALWVVRRSLAGARTDFREFIRSAWHGRAATALITVVVAGIALLAILQASRPIDAYDASTYALDGRRVAAAKSVRALMGFAPTAQDDQFANHNHGNSYAFYLAAGLMYAQDPAQDFSLRLAIQILAVHVFVLVIGLGLRISGRVVMLAIPLLLSYRAYAWLSGGYSRDFFRLLPLLMLFGLFREDRRWPGLNLRGLFVLATLCFLWNAHASSLMMAPLAVVCLMAFSPRPRAAALLAALLLASIPLGAPGLVRATVETGSPSAHSPFYNVNYEGTAVVQHWWAARGVLPGGWRHLPQRLAAQLKDGPMLVPALWGALVALAVRLGSRLLRRRPTRRLPLHIASAGLFLLASQLLLMGLLDLVAGGLSAALASNFRYRAQFYVLGAPLVAFVLLRFAQRAAPKRLHAAMVAVLSVVLLVASVTVSLSLLLGDLTNVGWDSFDDFRCFLFDSRKATEYLASRPHYRWLGYLSEVPQGDVILMDYAYVGWYHLDGKVLSTQDPRLRPAFTAETAEDALRVLDDLGIRYIFMIDLEAKAIFDSNIPLGQAIRSDAFELVEREPDYWHLYRRSARGDAASRGWL